jgi:hypothetical protein
MASDLLEVFRCRPTSEVNSRNPSLPDKSHKIADQEWQFDAFRQNDPGGPI